VLISFPDHKSFSPLIECKIFVEMHTFKARLYGGIFENSHLCIKPKKCIRVFWPRRSRGLKTGETKALYLQYNNLFTSFMVIEQLSVLLTY
jgi:hypothetical protein